MKSISPSAVILGPMVGIAMEGLLLEACVRLLGGHAAGYLVGGALAVSWSMVQRMLNALIAFGPDVVRLYVEAYNFASRVAGRLALRSLRPDRHAHRRRMGDRRHGRGPGPRDRSPRPPGMPAGGRAARAVCPASRPGAPIVAEGSWSLARLGLVSAGLLAGMAA